MKGDFSRFNIDARHRYRRVLMQQGRVQLDADWNEQARIAARQHEVAVADLLGPSAAPVGRAGFALRFHGGRRLEHDHHFVEISEGTARQVEGEFALDGWIRLEEKERGGTLLHRPWRDGHNGLRLLIEGGYLKLEVWDGDDDAERDRVASAGPLPLGRPVHILAQHGSGLLQLYVDGILAGETWRDAPVSFETLPLTLGRDHGDASTQSHFRGSVDRLRLWQRAFDAAEAPRLAEADAFEGLLSDWSFVSDEQDRLTDRHYDHHGRWSAAGGKYPSHCARELWIGAGHYYVDGVLSSNAAPIRCDAQFAVPGLSAADLPSGGTCLAYLESWDRVVGPWDDAGLLEPALGGADTALRLSQVDQVRLWPLAHHHRRHLPPRPQPATLAAEPDQAVPLDENRLYRVECHDSGYLAGAPYRITGRVQGYPLHRIEHGSGSDCVLLLQEPLACEPVLWLERQIELLHHDRHTLTGVVTAARRDRPGMLRLDLRLDQPWHGHRHAAGWLLRPLARFKWSADNGALACAVTQIDGALLTLAHSAQAEAALRSGDWVELYDDVTLLKQAPGRLRRIAGIAIGDDGALRLSLDAAWQDPWQRSDEDLLRHHPQIRRWEAMPGATPDAAAAPCRTVRTDETVRLAGGVLLTFGAGHVEAGDYWQIPLRHHLLWPQDGQHPAALPPMGPQRRRTELALIRSGARGGEIQDLRKIRGFDYDATLATAPQTYPPFESRHRLTDAIATMDALIAEESGTQAAGDADGRFHEALEGHARTVSALHDRIGDLERIRDLELRTGLQELARTEAAVQELWRVVRELQRVDRDAGLIAADQPILGESPIDAGTMPDLLPPGVCLLAREGDVPEGWRPTGMRFAERIAQPAWREYPLEAPFAGPVLAAACDRTIFCFWPDGALRALRPARVQDAWRVCRDGPAIGGDLSDAALVVWGRHLHLLALVHENGKPRGLHWVYDTVEDWWRELAPMPTPRQGFAAAAVAGTLYVAGGTHPGRTHPLSLVEAYSFERAQWRVAPSLPEPVVGAVAAAGEEHLYVIGGMSRGMLGFLRHDLAGVRSWSPATQRWMSAASLARPRHHALATVAGERLMVIGGETADGQTVPVELFRPAGGERLDAPQLRRRRHAGLCAIGGSFYLIGGTSGVRPENLIEVCRMEEAFVVVEREAD